MEDQEYYQDIINIFVKHYNIINHTKKNMFSDLVNYDDTNEIMEEFMEHISEFTTSDEFTKKIFSIDEIDIEQFEQLYGLQIDDRIICTCQLLFPLLDYLAINIKWKNTNWKILPMSVD